MSLPINIEALITKNVIESERIEFKQGWNPQVILHSICAFANNGSPKPVFETDSDNVYFLTTLPIHPQFKIDDNNSRPESRPESELATKVMRFLVGNELSKSELAKKLEHKTVSGELNKQIKWLLDHGFIERTIPGRSTGKEVALADDWCTTPPV